jgi:glycosyltransferase involved in cell wall biosynthesis
VAQRPEETLGELRAYRVAAGMARRILRLRPRERRPPGPPPKVTILLLHAYGMGGTIRATLNLAAHLATSHEVEILSVQRRRDEPCFAFPPGVTVTTADDRRPGAAPFPARILRRFRSRMLHPSDRMTANATLWTDLQLLRRLWRVRSGVLIGTRPALNMLVTEAGHRGLALVAAEHTTFRAYREPHVKGIRRRYPALDAVVVLTDREQRRFERVLKGATRVVTIPNSTAEPTGPPSALDRPVVLAAGRLERVKGFDRLVPAFAQVVREHPGWQLRICGGGDERNALLAQIDELGVAGNVELVGRVRDLEGEMQNASMFVLSSRAEGLPLVMLEAMAKGLPVVSFDCPGGPRNVITDGVEGVLVDNGDIDALARTIIALIEDEAQRRRLAAAGRRKALMYGPEAVGGQWNALMSELTATDRLAQPLLAPDPRADAASG